MQYIPENPVRKGLVWAVARLEAGGGSQKHSPSIATLQKYAKAVGGHLEIRLVRNT